MPKYVRALKKTSANFPVRSKPNPVSVFATVIIRGYQLFISPVLGPCCRFTPSCSEYTREAISRHGFIKGFSLGTRRLLKCHPFHPGGFDPVP
jgi:putative membrane protein insertion efficiency factor